jgi:N6-L-threonylcarbamoyladenine synthase
MEIFMIKNKNKNKNFVIAGGVASNLAIRESLINLSKEKNFTSIFPPTNLCSDNAAMIAWAGIERYKINLINDLQFPAKARWALDQNAPFLKGPGLKL